MRIGPQENPQPLTGFPPFVQVDRRDAIALPAVALVAHAGDQKMRCLADRGAAGGDGIIPRRQRPQQAEQLLRVQLRRHCLQQIEDLPAGGPIGRRRRRAGQRGVIGDLLRGQCRDVIPVAQRHPQRVVAIQTDGARHGIDQNRIVARHDTEQVPGS